MSDSSQMVSLAGLSKGFGSEETRVEVLKELDFTVDKGQMMAVAFGCLAAISGKKSAIFAFLPIVEFTVRTL